MLTHCSEVMSMIWHEPNTDNYWLGYSVPDQPTTCLLNVGRLLEYFSDYDPTTTLVELQKLINDWALMASKPEDILDDWTKEDIYKELKSPVNVAAKLHECIDASSLTQLYDYYKRGYPFPKAYEGKITP